MFAPALLGASVTAHAQLAVDAVALDPALLANAAPTMPEPFGLKAIPVTHGALLAKWNSVAAEIRAENDVLTSCRNHGGSCPPAAQNFLAVIDSGRAHDGRARIGIINRAINLAIRPTADLVQWGVPDRWSAPLATFTAGRGDCEDYAIAKYVALQAAGVAENDMRLVIIRELASEEDHAVLVVRLEGHWLVLDNRWLSLVDDGAMRRVVPLFVLARDGVKQFAPTTIATLRPAMAPAGRGDPAPSALTD